MTLSAFDSGEAFDSWFESRVAAFEEALRIDPDASPDRILADCPDASARNALAGELELVRAEFRPYRSGDRPFDEPARECIPERIGPFRIIANLGSGGFGRVYEAWDERLERPVALKLLREPWQGAEKPGSTFLTEARAVSRLRHPSIVVLFDLGEFEGQPFLVYERVEGSDLKTMLRSGPLPVGEALRIVEKVGMALVHAHDRGILHRDVKPSNILIDVAGEPFLTDFGLSGSLRADCGSEPGPACGTPGYMAPEQALGLAATQATDVYGLGMVLYEALTGLAPFAGPARIVHQCVIDRMPEPPSDRRPELDRRIDQIVLKALAKEPRRRFATVRSFVDEVSRALVVEGYRATDSDGVDYRIESLRSRFRAVCFGRVTQAMLACVMAFACWQLPKRNAMQPADEGLSLSVSASLARERMERERVRRFRAAEDAGSTTPSSDFAGFFGTLSKLGEGLPKAVRAQFLLDRAGACRNEGKPGEATNALIEAASLADSALKEQGNSGEAARARLDIARAIAGWSELPGLNSRRRLAEARLAVRLSRMIADAGGTKPTLAYDLITLANRLRSHGREEEAVGQYVAALEILRHIPETPDSPEQAIECARQRYLLAQALRGSGRKLEAALAYRLTGESLARLPAEIRLSPNWLDTDADRCFHEARLLRESGDPGSALLLCERAIGIWNDLAERLKSEGAGQYDLPRAHSKNLKGAILADLMDTNSAILSFGEAALHYRTVLDRDPEAINARRGLANVLHTSGRLHAESGRWDDALDDFERAIIVRQAIVGVTRGSEADRIDLAVSCQAFGQAKLSKGEIEHGLDFLRRAIFMFGELEKLRPDDRSLRERSSEAAGILARYLEMSESDRPNPDHRYSR